MKTRLTQKIFLISMILLLAGVTLAVAGQPAENNGAHIRAVDLSPGAIRVFGTGGWVDATEIDKVQAKGPRPAMTRLSPYINPSQVYVFGTSVQGQQNAAMAAQRSGSLMNFYRQDRGNSPGRIYVEGTGRRTHDAN